MTERDEEQAFVIIARLMDAASDEQKAFFLWSLRERYPEAFAWVVNQETAQEADEREARR